MSGQNEFRSVGEKRGLADRVVQEIETMILSGELEPDTSLPAERELAEQLNVSRSVVREAVRTLVTKGMLETRQGVGTTVRRPSADQVSGPLGLLLRTQSGGTVPFDKLRQVRSVLEIEIAGLAAEHATDEQVTRLRAAYQAMIDAQDDPVLLAERDHAFHRELATMTENPLFVILLDSIRDLLHDYISKVTRFLDADTEVLPVHLGVVESVEARDVEGARKAMVLHHEDLSSNYEKYVDRRGSADE